MEVVVFGVVLLQVVAPVLGFGSGAPAEVCGSMMPQHKNVQAQTSPTPYSIQISNRTFTTGQPVQVMIKGGEYSGLLLEARSGSNEKALGSWETPPLNTKYLQCSGNSQGAITHSNTNLKTNMTVFIWIPPSTSDNIYFMATVARNREVYWLHVKSETLSRGGSGSGSGPGSGSDPTVSITPAFLLLTALITTLL